MSIVSSSAAQVKLVRKKIKPTIARGEQTKGESIAAAPLPPMQPSTICNVYAWNLIEHERIPHKWHTFK
jgi:PBP1b-binding outer membrane lipoprotein LpoB